MILFVLFFLLGAIPFGWIIYKITANKDIRKEGSGNIGAANVYRLKGKVYGIIVLMLDASKGLLAVLISKYAFKDPLFWSLSALFTVLGHIFSPFLSFKGGKGVATAMGALAVISPKAFLISLLPTIILLFGTKIVSTASMAYSLLYPITFLFMEKTYSSSIPIFLISLLILYRHKDNIQRLIKKKERRIEI